MAQSRILLLKNKTINSVKIQKRQTATLLKEGKDESARIKAENIVRDDYLLDALDILHLFCDLLLTRINLIEELKECPHDMKEAISTLVYSAPRVDVEELMEIREQFQIKFGKEFIEGAMQNREMVVNQRVVMKLDLKVPKPHLVISYIKEIAKENGIEWEDLEEPEITQDQIDNPELGYPSRNEAAGYNVDFNPNTNILTQNPYSSTSPQFPNPNKVSNYSPTTSIQNSNIYSQPNTYSQPNHYSQPNTYSQSDPYLQQNIYQPPKAQIPKIQDFFNDEYEQTENNLPPLETNGNTPFDYNYSQAQEPDDEDDELQRRLRELSRPRNENDEKSDNDEGSGSDGNSYEDLKARFERLNRRG